MNDPGLHASITIMAFNILGKKLAFRRCGLHLCKNCSWNVEVLIHTAIFEFDLEDLIGIIVSEATNV